MKTNAEKLPSPWVSAIPLAVLTGLLYVVIRAFGGEAINGGSQIALLSATSVCVMLSIGIYRCKWSVLEDAIIDNIRASASAIIILLLIGAIAGSWMVSGVVPTMIYYGLKILHPSFFLVASCVICAGVSLMTGSSWTTIATIGVALMGTGQAMGFPEGWIAGAIISGAYFGDKISPLSETTTLASGSLGVQLFSHIRYMLLTTVPSITLALIIFAVAGLTIDTTETQEVASFMAALDGRFNITPWLLIVPVATGVLIARETPPIVTIFLSTLLAVACGLIFQREALAEIDPSLFKTTLSTSNQMLTELVSTRGMAGMTDTIWLIICAMCFGGTMAASGMVGGITRLFIHMVKGRTSLVASTATTGVMLNVAIADQIVEMGSSADLTVEKPGVDRQLALGVSARAEFVMPYFNIGVGLGTNFLHKGGDLKAFYQTLILKVAVTRSSYVRLQSPRFPHAQLPDAGRRIPIQQQIPAAPLNNSQLFSLLT